MEPFSPTPGTGEINEDPMFADPDNHDYHLLEGSPCIGTGMNGEDRGALAYVPVGVDNGPSGAPERFHLTQNYPNPFNASTTIVYQLPAAGHVRLEIFDLLGHKMATLVDADQTAGERSAHWEASQAATGIYLYRLTVGSSSEAKRMLLLR